MNHEYTLADIVQQTGTPVDRLRYVLDSGILPSNGLGGTDRINSRGAARIFNGYGAFTIVTAVLMLDAGVKRQTVIRCLELLMAYCPGSLSTSSSLLFKAYSVDEIIGLEIGDGVNIRLVCANLATVHGIELRWLQVETRAVLWNYVPVVTIGINLTRLRASLPPAR